ncbi:nicotinamide riboside transporter PnuC [Flavobacteriaceae bacterium]|nr:nicotinamide riboside transporter PnuC [Flavobacteriaceae bacterium]
MQDLINFFIEPYQNASALDIALEVIAVIFGILSVYFAKLERIAVFPTGIISTLIYVYICWVYSLYGDFIINSYYTLMSIYGWVLWSKSDVSHELKISRASKRDWIKALLIFGSTAILVIVVYKYFDRFDRLTDYSDTLTTGIFFAAMWLMANKKIEHWWLWIIANTISVPLYLFKGLGFTALQYSLFLILAYQGYFSWKKS